jgi:hypothetical protein
MSKKWTPSQSDVEWTRNFINALSGPEAVWVGTFGSLSVDVKKKTYRWHTMTSEIGTCERIDRVLQGSLGYTVEKADKVYAHCVGHPSEWLSEFCYGGEEPVSDVFKSLHEEVNKHT